MQSTTTTSFAAQEGERPARSRLTKRLLAPLAWLYTDTLGIVSRPKVLFTVAFADAASVFAAGYVQNMPAASTFWIALVAFAAVVMLNHLWSYTIAALADIAAQADKAATATAGVFLTTAGISYLARTELFPPLDLVIWSGLTFCLLLTIRLLTASIIRALSDAGCLVRRTVLAGAGKACEDLIAAIGKDRNIKILGVFDDRQGARALHPSGGLRRLGTFEELDEFCRAESVDLAIVTVPPRAEERLLHILQKLFSLQVDIRISALDSRLKFNARAYTYIGKVPMLAVMDKPLNDWDRAIKNIEDRVLGALLLAILSPVMAIVALAVRLDSKGPTLFKQKRYGFNNELIEVYKFRSMYVEQSDATAAKLVTRHDPRVTRIGRIIRKTSLDELPQLFNVLLGDMSLVGPRPHATQAKAGHDLYEDVVQGYFARHRVKPGVTGWAQVNGWRGETDTADKIAQRVECDLYYIDNWSVGFDLYILALTPFTLISAKNAY